MNYFYKGMKLPSYIPFPKFLLQTELSLNAQMVYALLLGRSNISASEKNCDRWMDERGAVFVIYPITNLAEHLHRGLSTIKKSLLELEQAGLVERKRMGMGKPNHLYVLIPDEAGCVLDDRAEMYLQESRNRSSYNGCVVGYHKSQDVSTIIKRDKNNRNTKSEEKLCFGCYENVFLTQREYDKLKSSYPAVLDNFIEQLSAYKKSSGKKYADDGATLVAWINRNNSSAKVERKYDCTEGGMFDMSIDTFWMTEREYNPEEAYYNAADGLYYCVDCKTPVEAYFVEKEKGKHPCMCKCRREAYEQREKERKTREHADTVDKLRQEAFSGKRMHDWKFENSQADIKQIEIAKKYVASWLEMEQRNQGLLYVVDVGRGKSFAAVCIVNAVIELEVCAKMINIATIINDLQSITGDERSNYIAKLCRYRLLVFDDLGAERGTEFAREQVYNVVNARWESGRPFIVTSNLTLQEMQNEEQMVLKRIYDRVLDVCRPVVFLGENFRANGRKNQLEMVQELWRDM